MWIRDAVAAPPRYSYFDWCIVNQHICLAFSRLARGEHHGKPRFRSWKILGLHDIGILLSPKNKQWSTLAEMDDAVQPCLKVVEATSLDHPIRARRLNLFICGAGAEDDFESQFKQSEVAVTAIPLENDNMRCHLPYRVARAGARKEQRINIFFRPVVRDIDCTRKR